MPDLAVFLAIWEVFLGLIESGTGERRMLTGTCSERQQAPKPGVFSDGGKPVLVLALKERPEDIFVESTTSAYFRAPVVGESIGVVARGM